MARANESPNPSHTSEKDAISTSLAYYRAIVESSTDLICRFRGDGILTFVNGAFCRRFEKTRESLVGTSFVPYISDEDRPLIDNLVASLSPDMAPYTHEHRTTFPNGETRWHQWTNIAVKDDHGRFLEYQAIGRDTTHAKAVASELEESLARSAQLHDRLLEAIESITEGFALYDADDRLVICNSHYREIYGISADLLVPGAKFEDHIRTSAYRGQIADAIGREEEWVRERVEQHQNPQGTYVQQLGNGRWLQINEQKTCDGGIVGVRTDITEHKNAEDALRLFRALMDHTSDFVEVIDPATGRFLDVNQRACDAHGYTREEYLALSVPEIDPMVGEMGWEAVHAEIRKVDCFVLETSHRRKDGSIFPVEVSCNHVMLDREYLLANVRDITERKQAEAALRESEERYKTIFQSAPDAVYVIGVEDGRAGRIVAANRLAAQLHGCEIDDIVGMPVTELDSPDSAEGRPERLRRILAGDRLTFEIEKRRRDGTEFPVEVTAEKVMLDGRVHILAFGRDVSARKQAEQALRQSEQKLAAIAATMPEVLYVFDLRTHESLFTNRELWEDLGYKGEQKPHSKSFVADQLLHPDDLARMPEMLARWETVQDKEVVETEYRLLDASGQWRWYLSRDTVYRRDEQGRVTQVIGTAQDITQRKQDEEERQALEAQMLQSQKLESLGVLAGGIAHDFNNLLSVILNYTSVLELKLPRDVPARPMVGEIEKAARRAGDLTRQMLAYAGKATFVVEPLKLDSLVREMANLLQSIVASNATIHMDLQPAVMEGDATQIRQVVMNLLTNASDALKEKPGTIRIFTGVRQLEASDLRSSFITEELAAGEYAYVIVSDNGSGMNDDVLQRIFDPFFSTKFDGRGLGLAAVLGIMRGHRGTVRVETAENQGTEFALYFPASEV